VLKIQLSQEDKISLLYRLQITIIQMKIKENKYNPQAIILMDFPVKESKIKTKKIKSYSIVRPKIIATYNKHQLTIRDS
jgi:hypothetical protein